VLSLIGCTRLRAVSGILRTQRGRRGSRGAGLHAGTGSAGPGRRGRPGPISTDLASRPVAQVLRSPLWLKSHARPCGSRPTLAPVAQVSRSPLWLYSGRRRGAGPGSHLHRPRLSPLWLKSHARPCGSSLTLAPVAQPSPLWLYSGRRRAVPNCHWSWVSSRAACWRAGSPARNATVVLVGCSGAGSGRGCRTWIAVCTVFSGARRRSEPALSCARIAGPSQCGGSPAPRGCASLGVTGLSAANQSPISMAPLRLLSRPSWRSGRASLPDARARAVTELAGTVRVSPNSCPPHSLASGSTMLATSPGQWPAHLRQILADSDAGPGSRISRPPRPEVTIRHVPIPSPLLANPVRAESARQARPV